MRQNKKKGIVGILVFIIMAGMLTGCNEKATNSDAKVNISVQVYSNPDTNPEAYKKELTSIQNFEKLHPDISVEPISWDFDTKSYMAKAEGNTLPTTYIVPLTEARNIMDLGYAADMTEEFKSRGFYDNVDDFILENISKDGNIYFLPTRCYDVGLLVNMDVYEQAGLVEADGTLYQPQTWEELAQAAVKIKEKTGKAGFVIPTTNNTGGWRFTPIAWSYGVVFEEKVNGKWRAAFDTPECVEALQFIKDLKWKYDVLPVNALIDLNEIDKQLGIGETAIALGEADVANRVVKYGLNVDRIGMLKIPAGPKRRVSLMGGGYQVIDRNADKAQIKAAMDWAEYRGYTMNLTEDVEASINNGIETNLAKGNIIGITSLSPWKDTSPVEQFKKQANQEKANIPLSNIKLYNDKSGVEYQAEEPIDAQALYAVLDSCIQEVLTNKDADCAKLIKKAAEDFQKNHLDYAE